jgi:hypothetical protein
MCFVNENTTLKTLSNFIFIRQESAQCGSPNNGCQHKCTNGTCSCNAGYDLSGSKQCIAKDCGKLTLTYCASGV